MVRDARRTALSVTARDPLNEGGFSQLGNRAAFRAQLESRGFIRPIYLCIHRAPREQFVRAKQV